MFWMDLIKKKDYLAVQHEHIGFFNREAEFLLRGTVRAKSLKRISGCIS